MSRTITTIVIATLFSSTLFGQTTPDPVADLTSQIISRYMPSRTTSSSFSSLAATAEDQAETTTQSRSVGVSASSGFSAASSGFTFGGLSSDIGKASTTSAMPMMMPRIGSSALPFFSQATRLPADQQVEAKENTTGGTAVASGSFAMPRLRSFSAASNNGIHAIQAVVPTEKGDEKVELKGTQDQVQTQLNKLSPELQRVMRRSLGL